jgi:flagellar biosynthetic protein FlhB
MAKDTGDKTEKPTPRRLREARKKGQIPRSVDLVQWLTLLAATFLLPSVLRNTLEVTADGMRQMVDLAGSGETAPALAAAASTSSRAAFSLAPLLGFVAVSAIIGMAAQGGLVITGDPLKPKWERISPKAGFKRLFSMQSVFDTAKAVARLGVLAILAGTTLFAAGRDHLLANGLDLRTSTGLLIDQTLLLLRLAALIGSVIGLADYAFQRWQSMKKLKMSKQEVRQEQKSSEGDPSLKGRRRQAHAKITRNQMLSAVPNAAVVIVNPTHYSVALEYHNDGGTPIVVAKGTDELAFRIRERARLAKVPIVESPPLTRALHASTEVGTPIPTEFFEAVAIVLAFVMRPRPHAAEVVRRVSIPNSKLPRSDDDLVGAG